MGDVRIVLLMVVAPFLIQFTNWLYIQMMANKLNQRINSSIGMSKGSVVVLISYAVAAIPALLYFDTDFLFVLPTGKLHFSNLIVACMAIPLYVLTSFVGLLLTKTFDVMRSVVLSVLSCIVLMVLLGGVSSLL